MERKPYKQPSKLELIRLRFPDIHAKLVERTKRLIEEFERSEHGGLSSERIYVRLSDEHEEIEDALKILELNNLELSVTLVKKLRREALKRDF